jgi:RNA polymerase sigma-70 factor (ECF subfamily)
MANGLDSRSDVELLRRSRSDPDGFVVVCRRYGEQLERWLRRELADDLVAQEVLAETFAAAWFAADRFRDHGEGAGPWLHGIAKNLVLRLRRDGAIESRARMRLGVPVLDQDNYDLALDRLGAAQEFDRFSDEFARLPAEQREALELRVIEALDYAEVGKRLRISSGAARARVLRALRSLRAQIGEQP